MAYAFDVPGVLALVSKFIAANFTAQGEPPAALPITTQMEQVAQARGDLPATVLQVKTVEFHEEGVNVGEIQCELPVTIHHLRATEPGVGSGAETALRRLTTLGAAFASDYQLDSVNTTDGIPIDRVHVLSVEVGEDNRVQAMLDELDQNLALVAVALPIVVTWVETLN